MKVTIVSAIRNSREHIESCFQSLISQTYSNIEHIVIDGCSTDGTGEIIDRYRPRIAKVVCERDNGIYDALNKGIRLATGEIIGILHSDDFYEHPRVIERVVNVFEDEGLDSCYGDLLYVSKANPDRVVRYWRSSPYRLGQFRKGWMPPHCTFFAKRALYEKYGLFRTDFEIAADYELMLRLLEKHRVSTHHVDEIFMRMRIGGVSNRSLANIIKKSCEDYRAWKVNGLRGGFGAVLFKNISKLPQLRSFFARTTLPVTWHAQNG